MSRSRQARRRLARREAFNLMLVILEAGWGRLPRGLSRPLGMVLRHMPGLARYGRPPSD